MDDNPYLHFVTRYQKLVQNGKGLPTQGVTPLVLPPLLSGAPKALIASPHPDDECLVGALPMRLRREQCTEVINLAVTLGMKKGKERLTERARRTRELSGACKYLGIRLIIAGNGRGLRDVYLTTRKHAPDTWHRMVTEVAEQVQALQPSFIFMPHEHEAHPDHVGTHYLVMDALAKLPHDFSCIIFNTEFWQPNPTPNLMIGSSAQDVAELITALAFHVGEVKRNPYHLELPAWMHDNVRRGAELVGGWGSPAPDLIFATLYQAQKWSNGHLTQILNKGKIIPPTASLGFLIQAEDKTG